MASRNNKSSQMSKEATSAKAEARRARAEAAKAKAELAREKGKVVAAGATSQLQGFIGFIREKGVIGLAIGLAIGTAATGVVTQVVGALITPTIVLILGANGLKSLNTTVEFAGRSATYAFGDLLDAVLKFLAVAAVIYFIVLGLKLDKLDKKKDA